PGWGYAWLPSPTATAAKPRIVTADGTTVRNEFFEAELDPTTGMLRSFRDSRSRVNRIGQMLVYQPGSAMKANRVQVIAAGAAVGIVQAEGELVDEHGVTLAEYKQTIRAVMGRPVLELRVELKPRKQPEGYPWHAYFGARFAWRDDRAVLFRGVDGSTYPTHANRPCSPDFAEIRFGSQRTFVFTGGLPFLQKQGGRMLDAVLVCQGEATSQFDFLLAMDREHPMHTAQGWVSPATVVPTELGPPPAGASGWLASLDWPGLLPTALRPIAPGPEASRAVLLRTQEIAGFGGVAELRFARDAARAYGTNLLGETGTGSPLNLLGDAVQLEFSAHELNTTRIEWR
ncbi:MAG: hypothetical protein ACRCZF_20655, partial [Gemmataceae bacterium]